MHSTITEEDSIGSTAEKGDYERNGKKATIYRYPIVAVMLIKTYDGESRCWKIHTDLIRMDDRIGTDKNGHIPIIGDKQELIAVLPAPAGSYMMEVYDEIRRELTVKTVWGSVADIPEIVKREYECPKEPSVWKERAEKGAEA